MRAFPGFFPTVYFATDDSIEMDRLRPLIGYVPNELVVRSIRRLSKLWNSKWPRDYKCEWSWDALFVYLKEQNHWSNVWLLPWLDRVRRYDMQQVPIHGDPTFENTMEDFQHNIRFIDPLPPGGKIPPCRFVDLGKLMQSAFGWDHDVKGVEFGLPWSRKTLDLAVDEIIAGCTESEKDRIFFWTAVHLRRILPYTEDPKVVAWVEEKLAYCKIAKGMIDVCL